MYLQKQGLFLALQRMQIGRRRVVVSTSPHAADKRKTGRALEAGPVFAG